MEPALQTFENTDPAFAQFVGSYSLANADTETRRQHNRWMIELGFHQMELQAERAEGLIEGEARGEIRGEIKGVNKVALNMIKMNMPIDQIIALTELSREEIEVLAN